MVYGFKLHPVTAVKPWFLRTVTLPYVRKATSDDVTKTFPIILDATGFLESVGRRSWKKLIG